MTYLYTEITCTMKINTKLVLLKCSDKLLYNSDILNTCFMLFMTTHTQNPTIAKSKQFLNFMLPPHFAWKPNSIAE